MSLLARKKFILAKAESSYGVDLTPTVGANAILTRNMSIVPLQANVIDRNLDSQNLGNSPVIHDAMNVAVSFEVELAGSGTAGTAPAWAPLLEACGFVGTVDAGVSVAYAPVSSSFDSVTIYAEFAGKLHKVTGCMGSVSFEVTPGGTPYMAYTFTGIYNAPVTSTLVPGDIDVSAFTIPLPVNKTNTTTASLHSVNLVVESLSLDMANDVQYRNMIGSEKVLIVDRAPTGSITFESTDFVTKNWFTTAVAGTQAALSIVHGTSAGNIVTFAASNVQITDPKYGETNGIETLQASLRLIPTSAGDDEISITLT